MIRTIKPISWDQHDNNEDKLFSFVPPLHIQRKRKVLDLVMKFIDGYYLQNSNASTKTQIKIIDVGCERGAFFQYFQAELIGLKNKFDTSYIGIDISEFTLSNETVENLNKFALGNSCNIRNGSVSIKLLNENILYPSYHLDRPDFLIMIEVIEHIKINDVNNILPRSIFGEICPKVAIITTPNADFNEIFGLKSRLQFRHWDHKFEWSRNEFKCWCEKVIELYPDYQYEIKDIGISDQYPLHGGGSQMVVFERTQPQPSFMNENLRLQSSVVFEKENLFSSLSEYEVIKNFLSFKMSLWAIEKHVSGVRIFDDRNNPDYDSDENLGILEYDEELSCEIFKIRVDVVENIVKQEYPDTDIDILNLIEHCSDYSFYFKLSKDEKYIYYNAEIDDNDDDVDEEEYLKIHSRLYENVQLLCDRIEDVDFVEQ